jgi:hypothetical protein
MMRAITPGAVLVGLLVSSPSLWRAIHDPAVSLDAALLRFLVGVVGAAVALALVRGLVEGYARGGGRPQRRGTDRLTDRVADRAGD